MEEKNYYELLQVSSDSKLADITLAFNRRLKEINESDAADKLDKLQIVIEAFSILSNEEKRADYDTYLQKGQALIIGEEENCTFNSTSLVERIRFEKTGADLEQRIPSLISKIDNVFSKVKDHTVRLKYKGKQIGPDIPMGYAIALEAMGLLGAGVVRTVVTNLGVKTLFDIEISSKSEEHVSTGDELLKNGDLDLAEKEYFTALELNNKSSLACMRLGVLNKIQGKKDEASKWFQKVISMDEVSKMAEAARLHLSKL